MDTEGASKNTLPLSVEPESIDFGCLRPGEGASTILKVSGESGKVLVHNDQLRVTPLTFGQGNSELQVMLLAGSGGELIWDNIVLQSDESETKVLVTARWEERTPSVLVKEQVVRGDATQASPIPSTEPPPAVERKFKGRVCGWCGQNMRYDTDRHAWVECERCRGAHKLVSVVLRTFRETRLGITGLGSSIVETWEVLIGKERQRK